MAAPSATVPDAQDRGSCQMATANLGQITQVQIADPDQEEAHPRDSTMAAEYASAPVQRAGTRTEARHTLEGDREAVSGVSAMGTAKGDS